VGQQAMTMKLSSYRVTAYWGCLLIVFFAVGCHRFPDDFPSRSLGEKIAIYERWIGEVGRPRYEARDWISWHGFPAADAMAPYISRQKKGIPRYEALQIVERVQLRGCSLRGTSAEQALRDYLNSNSAPGLDSEVARSVMESIRNNSHVENLDGLPPGPCSTQER
jgi:hypothetical protein